jgi:hypothetical protein
MSNYSITLTAAEDAALSYVAVSQDTWIQNAVHTRCQIAIDEIVAIVVQKCLETSTQIPNSKDDMVSLALQQGWIKTAAERHAEALAQQGV